MTRIINSELGTSPFQRLFHSERILQKWSDLSKCVSADGKLSKELKENVRRVLAFGNGCSYCQAKGTPLKPNEVKESHALGFAEVFLTQREKTEDEFFQVLKEALTDEEISELLAFICFTTAQQYFGALMEIK
ncbi:carboxymuconolactone decarboxylase family protein [Peribacillus muralis]|uniref:carboxymuconolactone decarboxylase family protein n=1 Tax=Peribacillus muralis TaxID=264697 RepID=UPI001F4E998C|nr:carboxymuconolactone decarboxylase family protein [Peribacillus muralis]MCK1993019.1 carboxymuconolactone decarboxylase family protein [Peribacillus muralis]MCK2013574.1 carboxymuconolactone decarboxylase family protein [Peribacillus muralis]